MLRLRFLGGASIDEEGVPLSGPAAHRHRLALLALLTSAHPDWLGREKLVAMLWPERAGEGGRNLLNQAVHALRKALGEETIVSAGDEVRLEGGRVRADVLEFRDAVAAEDHAAAVRLYAGPFLDGFFVPDSVPFERWAERERARLRRSYLEALQGLAEEAGSRGDVKAVVETWRRLAAEKPYSSRVTLRLMEALEAAGDRAAAIEHARVHALLLQEELQAQPDPAVQALAARMRTAPRSEAEVGSETPEAEAREPATGPRSAASSSVHRARRSGPSRMRLGRSAVALAALLALAAGLWMFLDAGSGVPEAEVDPDRVAVFPFRVGGASPSLDYLREGMVDLLAAKLTGDPGPRAVNSRTALSAWRREVEDAEAVPVDKVRTLAAGLGAGRALLGEVVGSPERLTITASLEPVDPQAARVVVEVHGGADSLALVVDRLVGRLLFGMTGHPETSGRSLETLTTSSLPALRAYLAGREAQRAGHRDEAVSHYNRALDRDSAFALAAIGLAEVSFGLPGGSSGRHPYVQRGLRLARAAKARLSREDRLYLEALSRPRYPANMFPWAEVIATWDSTATYALLDRPEAWYQLGLHLAQFGPQTGEEDVQDRAASAFSRAVGLDSTYLPALEHLIWLEAREGDRAAVERLVPLYRELDPSGASADAIRWRIALALDDREALADLRSRFRTMSSESLAIILAYGQVDGVGLDDVRRVARVLGERARARRIPVTAYGRFTSLNFLKSYALNGGRPRRADSLLGVRFEGLRDRRQYHYGRILAALYEDGDTTGVRESVRRLEDHRVVSGAELVGPAEEAGYRAMDLCHVWQWRLWWGDTVGAEPAIQEIREAEPVRDTPCATVLEILLAAERGGEAARRARSLAEEYVGGGWHWPAGFMLNFAAARLYERLGEPAAAVDALHHRPHRGNASWSLGHYLHEAGRLSLLAGDTAGALASYRHWLALHDDPEESRREKVARVRELVARLEAGGPPR